MPVGIPIQIAEIRESVKSAEVRSKRLNRECDRLATTDTQAGDSTAATGALQGVEQSHQNPRSTRANRVAERDGSAVDIQLLRGNGQFALRHHGNGCESLVDLKEIGAGNAPAELFE